MNVWHLLSRSTGVLVAAVLALGACTPTATAPTPLPSASQAPASSASADVLLPTPELSNVRLGVAGTPTANLLHVLVARYLQLDKKYGLTIEWSEFSNAAQGAQALLAGQIDVTDNAGGPPIGSLLTDTPLEVVYVVHDNLTDNLYGRADIKAAADLRGGSIAISSFGSQSHAGALLALGVLGLTTQEVTITQVGNDTARQAALKGGSVSAAILDSTRVAQMESLGMHVLVRLADSVAAGGVVRTALVVENSFAQENPNTVLALAAMYADAGVTWRKDPALAAKVLAQYAEVPLADAQADVDVVIKEPWRPLDGLCSPAIMEFTRETLLPGNPDLAGVDPTKACTNEFVQKLIDIGFYAKIGVPGY